MKITAVAPWFGSKRVLAPTIVEALGRHSAYWEPFCGSLAVLLAKPRCSQETVNDLHGDLINLALTLQDERWGPWLYRQLRRTLVHEEMLVMAKEKLGHPVDVFPGGLGVDQKARRAYWFFISSWLGRNGVIGTGENNNGFCVRYTANGGIQGTRFANAVDSIPAWRRRLRRVTILRRDAFELLARIEDAPGTAIYCDPPYLAKGVEYVHDFQPEDHERLAHLLQRFRRARVVVSYYDHPALADLYPGWGRQVVELAKGLANQGRRGKEGKVVAREVLLVNRPAEGRLF